MPPNQPSDEPYDALTACEDEVRAQLAVIAARRSEETIGFDKDMALCTAALTRALISSSSERRQQARAQARVVSDIPLDQILAYLCSLSDEQRENVCRVVSGEDDTKGLL